MDRNTFTDSDVISHINNNFEARNQGGKESSFEIYKLRMGFSGDSDRALTTYYNTDWGFESDTYTISSTKSTTAANMGFEEDIVYTQATAFDFRILERTIHVSITLPLLIAITALARFIILQGKEMDASALVYEAVAIVLIASAIVILRLRHSDKLGLKKKKSK